MAGTSGAFPTYSGLFPAISSGSISTSGRGGWNGTGIDISRVNPYLDQGRSFEDIARDTGYNLDDIRTFVDTTRPGYGVGGNSSTNQPYIGRSGSGGGSLDPQYNQAIGQLNNSLGRLDTQLGVARGNIEDQYNVGLNQLQSGFNAAQNTYNTQNTQNRQSLVGDRNNINDQASQGLRGLMRMLGAYGAGGSSDRFLAGDAVTSTANQQLSGAGQTYSGNQANLDTNWGNFRTQDEGERRKLGDWKTQQLQSAEQQALTNRQDILARLAELSNNRTAGAGQSYLDQANALSGQIDQLGRFTPTYSGNTPVFQAPTMDSYNSGQTGVAVGGNALQGGGSTPFLSLLLGQDDRRRKY